VRFVRFVVAHPLVFFSIQEPALISETGLIVVIFDRCPWNECALTGVVSSMQEPPSVFHVVLVEPEIAANTGAIGRTCVAAGATLWLVRPLGFHLDDRHVKRAALDYWKHLDLRVVDSLDEVVQRLGRDRLWSFSTKATLSYTEAVFRPGDAFVFGPESRGLPAGWLAERRDRALRIPVRPAARSLNLACAVSIAIYEGIRQIRLGSGFLASPGGEPFVRHGLEG
jgi:tRNA (cytidine/uridine-2'-O-)-methyltransferase